MVENKKYETCQGCSDRTVEPNCHITCKGYLERCSKAEKIKKIRQTESSIKGYYRNNFYI